MYQYSCRILHYTTGTYCNSIYLHHEAISLQPQQTSTAACTSNSVVYYIVADEIAHFPLPLFIPTIEAIVTATTNHQRQYTCTSTLSYITLLLTSAYCNSIYLHHRSHRYGHYKPSTAVHVPVPCRILHYIADRIACCNNVISAIEAIVAATETSTAVHVPCLSTIEAIVTATTEHQPQCMCQCPVIYYTLLLTRVLTVTVFIPTIGRPSLQPLSINGGACAVPCRMLHLLLTSACNQYLSLRHRIRRYSHYRRQQPGACTSATYVYLTIEAIVTATTNISSGTCTSALSYITLLLTSTYYISSYPHQKAIVAPLKTSCNPVYCQCPVVYYIVTDRVLTITVFIPTIEAIVTATTNINRSTCTSTLSYITLLLTSTYCNSIYLPTIEAIVTATTETSVNSVCTSTPVVYYIVTRNYLL
ncbi:unnamed protein product [Mytilus edulis]|uniref:Uncharacterized protein n=1 Tax=Mytilus edulis TaxID=6550 RepID=A0A8S3TUP8_MYTED|nr:unnamed protein product [Mytilus edulis]